MKIFNFILMGTLVAASMVSCNTAGGEFAVPQTQLEECVYMGDKTEFAVWAPDAEAAKARIRMNMMYARFIVICI